jgi:selenocysteine-specific elongation factor
VSGASHFIIATAGHVDHGKSALVKALTGTDPDRLPEEKARGITIDLGFAHLELPSPAGGSSMMQLGIVDVPGHEDFVKNMVAGVGSVDVALFVVAADDGWMPQTEEHLQILTYLGVSRAVVALAKADLVQNEQAAISAVREKLDETPFADAPVVPTSVATGRGLDKLKSALAQVLAGTPEPRDIGKPRLPVDRVFVLRGIGTVVTGTLTGGRLHRGQSVVIQPSGKTTRIRNIQSHSRDVEASGPGTRTALNLPDLTAQEDIRRGDVVTVAELGGPNGVLDVLLAVLPRASRPLKNGARVRVHHGSANVAAEVAFFAGKTLPVGERALAQLRLESPVFLLAGDRFIVRDWSEQNTLAGGIVLDPDASRKSFRVKERLRLLDRRAQAPDDVAAFVASQVAHDGAVRRSQVLVKSRFSAAEISSAISQLAAEGQLVLAGEFVVEAARWQKLRRSAEDAVDGWHRAHPEQPGLPLRDLRAALQADLPRDDIFAELIGELCSGEFAQEGTVIRRAGHRPELPPRLRAASAKLRAALNARPFDPPARKELATYSEGRQALRFMVETGEVVEISADVVMTADNLRRAAELVLRFIRERGPATVSDLRQALGSTRRVMVPLLEHLDRSGFTRRQGDTRVAR